MTFKKLKQRHREERAEQHENLRLRIHRALSWLQRAEMADDNDGRFIFLWIAFNAAYATEINSREHLSEQGTFKAFLQKLCSLDTDKRIDAMVWNEFSGSIRVLLDNPYVFQSFWEHQNGKIEEVAWKQRFAKGKQAAQKALGGGSTPTLLGEIFNRLYTLRNQLMHGGATWNSEVNRDQIRDGTNLLGKLVPLIIELMMDNPNTLWGDVSYPVIK